MSSVTNKGNVLLEFSLLTKQLILSELGGSQQTGLGQLSQTNIKCSSILSLYVSLK